MKIKEIGIKKVLERADGTRYVIVPKDAEIQKGEYILLKKISIKKTLLKEVSEQ